MQDGTKLVSSFNPRMKPGRGRVTVITDDMAVELVKVKALLAEGKKPEARALLQNAIKRNPRSASIAEAQKLLPQTVK
jgi:uncharacterized protein HemY